MTIKTIRNNKKILLATVIPFVVILTLILTTSLAKYKVTQSIKIVSGTINYSPSDFSLMGIYIESDNGYVSVDTIPESGYELNDDESYCEKSGVKQDVTISYDFDTKAISITPFTTKGLKCYLYFDEQILAKDTILANMTTIKTRSSFSSNVTSSTAKTIYTVEDDDGTSYYFAGAPTDNYVKFAGFYWRIIRINGDGTVRLIYDGTSARSNGTSSSATQISTTAFNSVISNNAYVGYMYTVGSVHGVGSNSKIKEVLDSWYVTNLTNYAGYIDINAGFCGDRQPSSTTGSIDGKGGTGSVTTTYYGAYIRLYYNRTPNLKCVYSSDLFTSKNSSKGNKALTYPIGLITLDEASYAGGVWGNANYNYYLYTGQGYWCISPNYYYGGSGYPYVSIIHNYGYLSGASSNSTFGVRPVINLRANVTLTGSGTSSNPYTVI